MAAQFVATVKGLSIYAVDLAHQARQIGLACVQHQVVVVAHDTVGPNARVKTASGLANDLQEQ